MKDYVPVSFEINYNDDMKYGPHENLNRGYNFYKIMTRVHIS